jgi:hypothetical protein
LDLLFVGIVGKMEGVDFTPVILTQQGVTVPSSYSPKIEKPAGLLVLDRKHLLLRLRLPHIIVVTSRYLIGVVFAAAKLCACFPVLCWIRKATSEHSEKDITGEL